MQPACEPALKVDFPGNDHVFTTTAALEHYTGHLILQEGTQILATLMDKLAAAAHIR